MFEKGQFLQGSTFDQLSGQARDAAILAGAVLAGVTTEYWPALPTLGSEAAGMFMIAVAVQKLRNHFLRQPDYQAWQ